MKRMTLAAAWLLMAGAVCASDEPSYQFSSSLEAWGYFNHQAPASDSALNPGNRVANVAAEQFVADTRLNLRLATDTVDWVVQPRYFGQSRQNGTGAGDKSDVFFRQAFGRLRIGADATLTAGRNVMAWGPANFRSPSSPFYFDSGKLNPLREVSGIDLVKLEYLAGPYTIAAGHVFDTGDENGMERDKTHFLKIDYQGADFLVSGNIAKTRDRKPFFGAYSQLNATEATMLYFEYGRGQRTYALGIDAAQHPPFPLTSPSESESTALLGMGYTLLNGQIISIEYLQDRHGYSSSEEEQYFSILKQNADLAVNAADPSVRGRSLSVLGLALNRAPNLLGREYLSVLWQSNPQESSRYWRVASTFNLQDRSSQITAYYEKNMSSRFSVFVNGVKNLGPNDSEYRSVVKHVFTVGIKAFLL